MRRGCRRWLASDSAQAAAVGHRARAGGPPGSDVLQITRRDQACACGHPGQSQRVVVFPVLSCKQKESLPNRWSPVIKSVPAIAI